MRAVFLVWAMGFAATGLARTAAAQGVGSESDEPRAAGAEARPAHAHFEQALVHYRAGRYRAAIVELRAAIALDPESKDLVYNLALVHEKLGELDAAISALERYAALEVDPKELERAEQALLRMRGAREEQALALQPAAAAHPPLAPALAPTPDSVPSRVDGWLVASAGASVAAAVVGVVFGVRALSLSPGSDPRTDANTSIEDLRRDRRRAERAALIADIGFAVSLATGAATAALWFGRVPARAEPGEQSSFAFAWSSSF